MKNFQLKTGSQEWEPVLFARKSKNPFKFASEGVFCTQSRSRTGTSVTSLVFETNASTDSAIWACGESESRSRSFQNGMQI